MNGSISTLDTWIVTDSIINNGYNIYNFLYVSGAGMRYQTLIVGEDIFTPQSPIGITGNINQTNNILLARDSGSNKLAIYVSSAVGTGAYYITKLITLIT